MTLNKAMSLARYESRQRRGGGRVRSLSHEQVASDDQMLAEFVGKEPTPEFAAMMADQCRRLFEKLGDPQLREVAVAKMEGCSNQEIAQRLDCALRTVERRLKLIRDEWKAEIE